MIIDLVKELVEDNQLRTKNRRRRKVNQRCYLINQMRTYGYTYRDICNVFELTHASCVHANNRAELWESYKEKTYLLDTEHLRSIFENIIVERSVLDFINDVKYCGSIRELEAIQERLKRKEYKFETQL
jgi:hypothetical protein